LSGFFFNKCTAHRIVCSLVLQALDEPMGCQISEAVCATAAAAAALLPCAAQAAYLPLCGTFSAPNGFPSGLPACAASAGVTGICATASLCSMAATAGGSPALPGRAIDNIPAATFSIIVPSDSDFTWPPCQHHPVPHVTLPCETLELLSSCCSTWLS
jgi:hypothetical protein